MMLRLLISLHMQAGQRHFRFFLRRQAVVKGLQPWIAGVVRDIRNLGLLGAVEIEAAPNAPGQWARTVATRCFENGIFVRTLGDTLILSPPLIINEDQIDQIADGIKNGIRAL